MPSELNAAYLYAQLEMADDIFENRMKTWNAYQEAFLELEQSEKIALPYIPNTCKHNAHMFYIKAKNLEERTKLITYLKTNGIHAVFHYVPLHTAPAGRKYGEFVGEDKYTTKESERLVRMPLYYGMSDQDTDKVIEQVRSFYRSV